MKNKILYNYFFILFSIIPISLLVGSAVSSINILIISISFLIYLFYLKNWQFLKNKNIQLLLILYCYLIFNSFISLDFNVGVARNFGFIQYILFFIALNYFFYRYEKFSKIIFFWFLVIVVVFLDILFESYTGKNILGHGHHERIYSFFKDEPKVGGYMNCFYLIIVGYFFNIYNSKSLKIKYLIVTMSILFLLSISLTGERSNTIKALIAFLIFFTLSKNFSIKEKIICFITPVLLFGVIYINSDYLKYRYGSLINKRLKINSTVNYVKKEIINIKNENKIEISDEEKDNFNRSLGANYLRLYLSSLRVVKNYPIFGVGNKNYRIVTCTKYSTESGGTVKYQLYKSQSSKEHEIFNSSYICNTHPHQIYFEFLSEHGIVGTLILLVIFFKLIFQILRGINFNQNNVQLGCIVYVILIFMPIIPSGSFFNNYTSTLFWINFSLMFAINRNINIFK